MWLWSTSRKVSLESKSPDLWISLTLCRVSDLCLQGALRGLELLIMSWTRAFQQKKLGQLNWVFPKVQFSSVQFSCSVMSNSATPWTAARQASLSITNSQSLPNLNSIELMMPSNHLILCCPLHLLPSIFPNIRVFSNESALHIRWPKYWSFSFNTSPSNEYTIDLGVYKFM